MKGVLKSHGNRLIDDVVLRQGELRGAGRALPQLSWVMEDNPIDQGEEVEIQIGTQVFRAEVQLVSPRLVGGFDLHAEVFGYPHPTE